MAAAGPETTRTECRSGCYILVMSYRDVTELLRVDTNLADTDSTDRAVARIGQGMTTTVASDRVAKAVLVRLGLTSERADFRIRMSHGPMA